ncbi:MAG: hypothetical protein WEF50_05380 [Myxococcota bacterium]
MRRALLLAVCFFACSKSGAPPYGFATSPEQRWRFEAEETYDVSGTPAQSVRLANVILRAKPEPDGTTEVELFIDRYAARTEGTPDGGSELSISEQGFWVQTKETGRVGFGPDEKTLAGDTPLEMRKRAVASASLDTNGDVLAPIWQSPSPVLIDVALLDWLIFALPTRAPLGERAWVARRTIPQTGRFNLGVDLPVRWELDPDKPDTVRASGSVTRESMRVADDLEGRLVLDVRGEAEVEPDGRVRRATFELRLELVSPDGTRVSSRHRVRATCTSCDPSINSPAGSSDSAKDREGIPQQGHLDDLPDHGGVRRGF